MSGVVSLFGLGLGLGLGVSGQEATSCNQGLGLGVGLWTLRISFKTERFLIISRLV